MKTFPLADSGIRGIVGNVRGMMTPHFTFYDKIKLLAHFLKCFLPSAPLVAAPKITGNVKPIFQCKGKQWTMEAIEVHYKSLSVKVFCLTEQYCFAFIKRTPSQIFCIKSF